MPNLKSRRVSKKNNEDLTYPYKPPTERGKNLLDMEDSIYKDSKNMSLDIQQSLQN